MKMPNPIAIRFAKLIFSILSITVLGVIFAMISHDHKLLILSAGVAITGGVKACSFYRQVSRQQYECLEGLLVQEQVNIHRKRHAIVLELENGSHVQRVLDGRYKLKAGSLYRFYLRPMISRISRRPFSRPRLYLALKNSLFLQASRFRYSGMCIIGMLCLQCSLLDVFSSGSFLRCEPVSFTQAY